MAKAQAAARKKREDQAERLAAAHAKLGTASFKGANDEDEGAIVNDDVIPYDPYGIMSGPKRIPGVALVATGDVELDLGLGDALKRRELGDISASAWSKRSVYDSRNPPGHAVKPLPPQPPPLGMGFYQVRQQHRIIGLPFMVCFEMPSA